ncbi:MAG: YDG domain-containing protein [Roseburia faecis]
MIWKWKWKRPAAFLLAAAMIFTMPGVPASAVETDVSTAPGNAPAECSCETHCEQGAVDPDCPVCAAEDADLSACKGTEQAISLMAAEADDETISGNVTWENRNITTPVTVKGDTTITLKGENTITITETAYTAALDMYSASLTIQGSGSLTVNVPKGKSGIADGSWSDTAGGTLTIKDGAKITTNGGLYGLYAKSIVIENGTLKLNSGYGIVAASLTMNGGTLYATGKYGAIWSRKGTARSIDPSLTILYSDEQNANTDDMSVGTADDTTREDEVKTIYIAKMGPRASLTVGAQQGTLQESLGSQTATFSVTGSKVKMENLQVDWVGAHPGLTAEKSADNQTITVTADNTVKEGRYKLKLTADGEAGATPAKATATATVTVAAAPRNPITIRTQPQVSYKKGDGQFKADVWVRAQLEGGTSGNITYQWYVNGKEFKGTGSGSNRITLTTSDLTTTAGKNWEYSGRVYCKLSYQSYTLDTNTVPVTFNTCPHEKYANDGKCQQCGEPCSKDVLFIRNGIPYTFEGDNPEVGFILFSGGTAYFVRDANETLKAGNGDTANKDVTLDLQGHKVKLLDLQNFPYKSVTIQNGTINDIATSAPTVLILDSVKTDQEVFSTYFTLTVKGNCVFEQLVKFHGKTQLQGGKFQDGIRVEPGEQALALLADGYAFAGTDDSEILNVSEVSIQSRSVKVVEHTCQYQNGKCVCGRVCDHEGKVDNAGYCTFCKALVEAFEIGGKRYTSLENALAAAQDRDTITLRGPLEIENVEPIEVSKNIVLNLNGHTLSKSAENALLRILDSNVAIINGKVLSTCTSKPATAVQVGKFNHTGAKLTLNDVTLEGSVGGGIGSGGVGLSIFTGNEAVVTSGTFPGGIYTEGALTMSGGSADQLELGALDGIQVTLSGGSFDSIKIENGADYQSLLAEGYAYQKQGGALLKLSEMNENTAVTVVKCSHPDDSSGGNVCPCCGYAAAVTKTDGSISYHRTADAAIAAADGGTVKLLADAGEITISSPLKLDLNGKTAAKLTVTGDVTLASLLPEDYAFKSGSTWISDLSRTELTDVSMAKLPIKSMDYETKMSMTYGGAGTLLVKVAKENGAGAVSFQWYQVEDGTATAVGSATTKNQFDLYALKLSVGRHTFRFSATCDGYEKMSGDIAVTVQKANISSSLITPPTAQENLTYTGQEQALITAGSVANYGTMQYSLTENGTYSHDIPTGTDAGTYTVWYRVIGDANHNDTAPASVAVSIGKKPLTITKVVCADKIYDGTTTVEPTSVIFDNMTLNRGTDYTVTARFDDASVGNGKNITATVTLTEQTAKNYALEQSSFMTTGSITKAAAPDFTKETALVIVNGHEKTYTVALPTLPPLETPKEYGALTYEISEIKLDGRYYTSGAKVENGKLTLPIQKNDVKTTGSVGTVTVVIKSTNYEDITLTVNVNATDKLVPTVTAPTANALTYNGSEQALVTAGKTTGGTMLYRLGDSKWSEKIPTAKNAGKYTVWYKVQGNTEYADVAEQSLTVTVSDRPSGGGGASGGGGGGAAPAPTPADADVITVKKDTKDNTTSKPGAETDTTTTTKTTVKNTTTETTKNEQGQDVSKTTASVSKDLGDKLLDQAVSNKSDTIEITVKSNETNNNGSGAGASAADSVKATEVELPKATVNAIAKDTNADLVIKTDNGEVVLDNKTLETIAGVANGDTVTIVVGENTQLKETQKPAEKIVGKNGTLFDLVAKIGEKHLHQFEGGKAYVTLPMPDKLKGKDILVIYIDDNGLCKILNHSVVKIGAEDYIRFTTTRFSTFAVVDKDEAERLIKEQNAAHVKELMQSAKFKVTTTKTSKKSVKVQVAAKSSKTMISDIKSLGYTVKYQFYRSTKKDAGYKLLKTSSKNSFISTKGTKGRKYYYKARVLVYDGSELVAKSALKQCSYGARR